MNHNPDTQRAAAAQTARGEARTADSLVGWQKVMQQILAALLASSLVFLIERVLIQLLSINYHRKQFDQKIKESKHNVYLLGLLFEASRSLFPMYCNEFAEEDYVINDTLDLTSFGSKRHTKSGPSGAVTPMRFIHDVGRFGDKITSVFGNVAQEITGKRVFDPNSAHSIVVEALEKNRSAEALAKRLWMSFVVEGRESLYQEDIQEVLGTNQQAEAEECFASLDRDGNGDISLDEMILTVTEFARERKSIASSMHDVDQAINVLDALLSTVVFVVCIFVFGKCVYTKGMIMLTASSRLSQPKLRYNACNRWYRPAIAFFRLCSDMPRSSRFLHLPLRQAPIRYRRPHRHRNRPTHCRAHLPALHRLQTR